MAYSMSIWFDDYYRKKIKSVFGNQKNWDRYREQILEKDRILYNLFLCHVLI